MSRERVAHALAAAFLASDGTLADMTARGRAAVGLPRARWVERLAGELAQVPPEIRETLSLARLTRGIASSGVFRAVWLAAGRSPRARRPRVPDDFALAHGMRPERRFDVPVLGSDPALAGWLGLSLGELDAFADTKGWLARFPSGPLQHYRHHWLPKADGSRRLVEAPKEILRDLQRRILHGILDRVPPHDAAHGFTRGRSIVSYGAPHAGQELVIRLDLRDFFPSIGAARVAALFRRLGYPRGVAWLLTGLVTTRTPLALLEESGLSLGAQARFSVRHLPQGAPTSPALANLCAHALDARLVGAARAFEARYTRYADDLAFSGGRGFRRRAEAFRLLVCSIAAQEGFEIHWEKNRWMRSHERQHLTGLVVNARPRPSREAFDQLKAVLHNCRKLGPARQNRERHADFRAHLRGRVAWFEDVDPARGARLREDFDAIVWPE